MLRALPHHAYAIRKKSLFIGALLLTGGVMGAPPPDHPSAEQAMRQLGVQTSPPGQMLPYRGRVRQAMDSNSFTYVEVEVLTEGIISRRWIAVPLTRLTPGDEIRFGQGQTVSPFFSKKLLISFESITFVGDIVIEKKTEDPLKSTAPEK